MRVGSLCTGYDGLGLGLELAGFDVDRTWFAEVDPAMSRVLAHHWPATPNLGDIRSTDWTQVAPVDVVTTGYPCQPLSLAGRRGGLTDERWLWDDGVFPAIRDLRPGIVLLENVPGHLSLGFGRVLGDLASIGYVGSWRCLRASDVGAPHRRNRVFILARPAHTTGDARWFGHRDCGRPAGLLSRDGGLNLLPTPKARDFRSDSPAEHARKSPALHAVSALLPTPRATDGTKGGPNQRGSSGDLMLPSAVIQLLPTPTATPYGNNQSASDGAVVRPSLDSLATADRWGQYAAAIARWEQVLGRPAPDPTEPGAKGQPRLSPRFVEWMQGLPEGHVTDHTSRTESLRGLGNGVVPQQCAAAVAQLVRAGVAA
jgi:DNA (cytosine-5)-methyltransferase 1